MATYGFGVDKTPGGSGTNSSDIRKIYGGLYSPGVISGCTIIRSATDLTYTVAAGVVAIQVTPGEIILAPVEQTIVPAAAATNRTDLVYVRQNFPSDPAPNDNSAVQLGVATVLPSRSVEIGRFIVTAGQTNSNQFVPTGGISYSIPYGGGLGVLHYWQKPHNGLIMNELYRDGYGTFKLPTDRRVRFTVTAVVSANGAVGFDNSKYVEHGFLFNIDGGDFVLHTTPGLHQAWATYQFSSEITVLAGTHTVNLGAVRVGGTGQTYVHQGTDGSGYGRRGIEFLVEDEGPAI